MIGPADTVIVDAISGFGEVVVTQQERPFAQLPLLFIGRQGEVRSQLLASYDFTRVLRQADSLGAALDLPNIKRADLFLYCVESYRDQRDADSTLVVKTYEVRELAAPLDPGSYPGPAPAFRPDLLSRSTSSPQAPMRLPLPGEAIARWAADPASFHGLVVAEDEAVSDPGLLGFAASGFPYASRELPWTYEEEVIGPVLLIEFREPGGTFILLQPEQDVSTLSGLAAPPRSIEEGILLQTHLRVYPRLQFDLTTLPRHVVVNRAAIVLTRDEGRSFGPALELVVLEAHGGPIADDEIELSELSQEARTVSALYGIDPREGGRLELGVTNCLRRLLSWDVSVPIEFMLIAGEQFTGCDQDGLPGDYALSRLYWHGTAHPDPAARPHLVVIYSPISD